jgi:hypothetical protein
MKLLASAIRDVTIAKNTEKEEYEVRQPGCAVNVSRRC